MLRKGLWRLIQVALIPVICGLMGLMLMALAFLLPTEGIRAHVMDALEIFDQETCYFSVTPGDDGTRLDNYTDALYLNQAMVSAKDVGLLKSILGGYIYSYEGFDPDEADPVDQLHHYLEEPDQRLLVDDSKRFFNGYEILVKPLLMLTDYSGIRQINMYLCLLLSGLLLYAMEKRGLRRYIPAVAVSILMMRPLTLALIMTYVGFYICMIVPCIILLLMKRETVQEKGWLLFGITGAVTYYFNMNYIQLLSFGVPMMFYFLVTGLPEKPMEATRKTIYCFSAWMIGLVGMMVFKWLISALLLDGSILGQMLGRFFLRAADDRGSRFSAITDNFEMAFSNPWWVILEVGFIGYSLVMQFRQGGKGISLTGVTLLLMMMALVSVRYYILANHVIIHAWVMYRLVMIPVLALNLLLTSPDGEWTGKAKKGKQERKIGRTA